MLLLRVVFNSFCCSTACACSWLICALSWLKRKKAVRTCCEPTSATSVTDSAISIPVATATIVDVYFGRKPNSVSRLRPT